MFPIQTILHHTRIQFNATDDRKVLEPSLGVTCLDCHVNGHTNAAFHENPDTRPQESRFRLDTVSLTKSTNYDSDRAVLIGQ